jgi:hypothetical protein
MTDALTTLRQIVCELPRRQVAFGLLVVLVNAVAVGVCRGAQIGCERSALELSIYRSYRDSITYFVEGKESAPNPQPMDKPEPEAHFILPWQWTADEWLQTVWPWK